MLVQLIQDGVIRNIEILGETVNNIKKSAPDFADKHPEIPWVAIYAMRNRISHAYFQVDLGGLQQARTKPATVFSYTIQASDADGDTLSQAPSGATINSQTGVLTWRPTVAGNYSFTISVSVSVSVSDGKGGVALQPCVGSDSALRVDWSDFLGTAPDQRSLAEKTGLVVKVKG